VGDIGYGIAILLCIKIQHQNKVWCLFINRETWTFITTSIFNMSLVIVVWIWRKKICTELLTCILRITDLTVIIYFTRISMEHIHSCSQSSRFQIFYMSLFQSQYWAHDDRLNYLFGVGNDRRDWMTFLGVSAGFCNSPETKLSIRP